MTINKCLICHHSKDGQCTRIGKSCNEVQDDSLFDPCGVTQDEGSAWEIEKKHGRKKSLRKRYEDESITESWEFQE